jgi:hypothetical protein
VRRSEREEGGKGDLHASQSSTTSHASNEKGPSPSPPWPLSPHHESHPSPPHHHTGPPPPPHFSPFPPHLNRMRPCECSLPMMPVTPGPEWIPTRIQTGWSPTKNTWGTEREGGWSGGGGGGMRHKESEWIPTRIQTSRVTDCMAIAPPCPPTLLPSSLCPPALLPPSLCPPALLYSCPPLTSRVTDCMAMATSMTWSTEFSTFPERLETSM